jgi:hypothetical protein
LRKLDRTATDAHWHHFAPPHHLEEDGGAEVVLSQGKVGPDAQIALTQGNKNHDLQNQVGIEILHLSPIMVKEPMEEVARRCLKPPLMEVCKAADITGGRVQLIFIAGRQSTPAARHSSPDGGAHPQ